MFMAIRWAKRIENLSDITQAKEQGFQIVQLPVEAIMKLDQSDFREIKQSLLRTGLSFEVFESPLPEGVSTTERGFNIYSWIEYLKETIARIAALGCKTLVWGDGKARILPEDGEVTAIKENFNQFLFMLAEIAEKYGIVFCLEPLGPRETNFLNSMKEVVGVINSIGKKNLAIMISSNDIAEIGTNASEIDFYRNLIAHTYLNFPREAQRQACKEPAFRYSPDIQNYIPFFSILKKIAYDKVIALPSMADSQMLMACKDAWAE